MFRELCYRHGNAIIKRLTFYGHGHSLHVRILSHQHSMFDFITASKVQTVDDIKL